MPEKEFNRVLGRYIVERTMDCEEYEAMTWAQRDIIQDLKRKFKRDNYVSKKHDK